MKETIQFHVTPADGGFLLTVVYPRTAIPTTRHIRASTSEVAMKIQEILIEKMRDATDPGEQTVASKE